MKYMKQYSGAVLFIDMLGIGALTRGRIPLTELEHAQWNVGAAMTGRHQLLGAKLLMQFRRSLVHTQKACPLVKVAQLFGLRLSLGIQSSRCRQRSKRGDVARN